ncbi:MAG: MFS transporter [Candidatus Saccharimonadales bacterium]
MKGILMNTQSLWRNVRLLQLEMVITAMIFAMPILNVFYKDEIGMSLAQVGASQAVFTIAVLLLNIPTGWLADRFSRRWCNVFGDLTASAGFFYYAFAESFSDVVIAEIAIGIGMAFSSGADIGLLRAYAQSLKISYQKLAAATNTLRPIGEMIAMIIGGIVGATQPRLAIGLSAATYLMGALISLFIKEVGERRVTQTHPLRDMANIAHYALHGHRPLAWRIFAYAIGRTVTHPLIWLFTPLMILAGVPAQIIGVGWALNLAMVSVGSFVAHRWSEQLPEWQQFAVGSITFILAATTLAINTSLVTISIYCLFGFVRGWMASTTLPALQAYTPDDIQSTVTSVAASTAQLMYIPLVWGFGALADISLQASLLGSIVIFSPLLILATYKIKHFS